MTELCIVLLILLFCLYLLIVFINTISFPPIMHFKNTLKKKKKSNFNIIVA